ncbi:phosphatase 2C-like domain-containing protein [Echria macrotheca]|uniref:Phosphatase 2C-like domain-containing protein n=1 Tax=Echria macrotheca TaxID=438768 RepID=A0AAJ0B1T2_9PEZI|nr:phosphatase 2C-like domain-containing protein [Echria macrotheca]
MFRRPRIVGLRADILRGGYRVLEGGARQRWLPMTSPSPTLSRSASRSSIQQGETGRQKNWKLATAAIGCLLAVSLYLDPAGTIRFDSPPDPDKPGSGSRDLGIAARIRLATRALPEDLQTNASVDAIAHRTAREHTLDAPNPDELTEILRRHEESVIVGGRSGVLRYDTNQIASNDPMEDDHASEIISLPSGDDWIFWGVYDGHSGWATSAKLRQSLIANVYLKLAEAYRASDTTPPSDREIDSAIKAGFLALDDEIVWSSVERVKKLGTRQAGAQLLAPAIAGSCALLAIYNPQSRLLRIALAGDSRAVLGRRVGESRWSATQLSADQTGENPDEAARVRSEHPDEPDVVKNGRVVGFEPSRAFGDAVVKWPSDLSMTLRKLYFAKRPRKVDGNPPYLTAEPVITTTKIEPEKSDFVVLASDSLWELLSNEEVVGLVGRWIDEGYLKGQRKSEQKRSSVWNMVPWVFNEPESMTSNVDKSQPDTPKPFGRPPVRPAQWGIAKRQRVPVVRDINAATHLARNGLGGDDHDLISSLFLLAGKNSRRFRDDLTITVIFFGDNA